MTQFDEHIFRMGWNHQLVFHFYEGGSFLEDYGKLRNCIGKTQRQRSQQFCQKDRDFSSLFAQRR